MHRWSRDWHTAIPYRCHTVVTQPIVDRIQVSIDTLSLEELGVLSVNVHGRAGRTSHRNALFLYRLRPQIALLSEVGANGGERGLHHGRVEPCGRITVLCFFQ